MTRPKQDPLARLVAEGRAAAPTRPLEKLPRPLKIALDRPLTQLLDELRDERL